MGEARVCSRHQRYCQDGECPYCERPADARIALPPVEVVAQKKESATAEMAGLYSNLGLLPGEWAAYQGALPGSKDEPQPRLYRNRPEVESDLRCPHHRFQRERGYTSPSAYVEVHNPVMTLMRCAEDCVQCALARVGTLRHALGQVLCVYSSYRAAPVKTADFVLLEAAACILHEDARRWSRPR